MVTKRDDPRAYNTVTICHYMYFHFLVAMSWRKTNDVGTKQKVSCWPPLFYLVFVLKICKRASQRRKLKQKNLICFYSGIESLFYITNLLVKPKLIGRSLCSSKWKGWKMRWCFSVRNPPKTSQRSKIRSTKGLTS